MESPNNIPLLTGTTDEVVVGGGEKEIVLSLNSKETILDNEKSYQNHDNFNLQNHVNSDFDPEEFISSSSGSDMSGGDEFDDDDDDYNNERDKETSSASESEEDLDFLDEDECSEAEAIFEDALLKFRQKLDSKVDHAEKFFDRGVLRGRKSVNVGIQTEEEPSNHSNNVVLVPLRSSSSRINCEINSIKCVETQTDDTSVSAMLLSSFREDPECARSEVAKLRDAREPLNLERKRMIERLKAAKKANETSGYRVGGWEEEEKQLFELEEAIEAIDLAIEFKNEIICGGQSSVLLDKLAPGQERAELVTRLASLSVFDLQRLFCKVFVKVVELRFSAKELERNVDKLERESKQMRRTISINKKTLKEKDEEHENGIKRLLRECAKTSGVASAGGEVIWLTQELSKAKRKLIDFQHALTELLVRHGYLIDGADFDVKHVVRMLGIDFGELNKQLEARPSHHQHHSSTQQNHFTRRNINHRRNAEAENAVPFHLAPSSSSRRHHPSTTNHPLEYGYGGTSSHPYHPQRSNQPHSSSSSRYNHHVPFEGYRDRGNGERETIRDRESRHGQSRHVKVHNNHHHQDRNGHFQQVQMHEERLPHGTEVKRLKKKLIIQPNSSQ